MVWETPLRTDGEPRPRAHPALIGWRRPEATGELVQFHQAINWMRTSLPELAELKATLSVLLEECLFNARRTKRAAALHAIDGNEWTDEGMVAWDVVRLRVSEAVPLNPIKPGFPVMVFPHTNDKLWGTCIIHVQMVELRGSVAIAEMAQD